MSESRAGWAQAAGWLIFPVVPVLLARTFHELTNFQTDPRDWDLSDWAFRPGSLIGFGFLAGATALLPDPDGLRGLRRLIGRRAVWVAVGPWLGEIVVWSVLFALEFIDRRIVSLPSPNISVPPWLTTTLTWAGIGFYCYGWTLVAWAALRRARRQGRLGAALLRGAATALAFVGSLFGTFWIATELWHDYFFDKTMP